MPQGRGFGRGLGGRGQMGGNKPGAGPAGYCICPKCKKRVPHDRGVPCYNINCPSCGTKMVRE